MKWMFARVMRLVRRPRIDSAKERVAAGEAVRAGMTVVSSACEA